MCIEAAKTRWSILFASLLTFTFIVFAEDGISPLVADAASSGSKTISGEIAETTAIFEKITISENISAPDGYCLTLISDNKERDVVAGKTYKNARLIVTPMIDFPVSLGVRSWDGTVGAIGTAELVPTASPFGWHTALYVDDGIRREYSITDAAAGGAVTDAEAVGISIDAQSDDFSALMIEKGNYTLKNATIVLDSDASGGTTNDFIGLGAAISATTPAKWGMSGIPGGPGGAEARERQALRVLQAAGRKIQVLRVAQARQAGRVHPEARGRQVLRAGRGWRKRQTRVRIHSAPEVRF